LGYPDEFFKFCMENGMQACAITEHGSYNSYAHAQIFVDEFNKANSEKQFKYLPGIEAYYHPDLEQWKCDKDAHDAAAEEKKEEKKLDKGRQGRPASDDSDDDEAETSNQLVLENEEETKSFKKFNPLNRRHHLLILPKNAAGLQKTFAMVSKSYLKSFYRFPRIDLGDLREAAGTEGNIVATSACLGGPLAWEMFRCIEDIEFNSFTWDLLDTSLMDRCIAAVEPTYEALAGAVGRDSFYLELQFNRIPAQHFVNRVILEFAKRKGLEHMLVVTCDAHYSRPDLWREREIYKALGFMNYTDLSPDSIPKSREELRYELWPKNAGQLWDYYGLCTAGMPFYDDSVVCAAVERTHEIAFDVIGTIKPDKTVKLPKKLVPAGKTPFKYLVELCVDGMKKRGLQDKEEYVVRLKEELEVIKFLNVSEYFVTLQRIMELAREVVLCGCARGSGGGSLVNYVLYITELDPIRWDLPFARFLSKFRVGMADVDTDISDRDKVLDVLRKEFGFENVVPISNYNCFKLKSLLKDLSKFYGIPFEEVNEATRTVEQEVRKATTKHGDDKNLFVLKYDDALQYCKSFKSFIDKHPEVGQSMNILFKQNRSLGRHAGGVLICDDLPSKMPLITSKGEPQSAFCEGVNFKHLEKIGNFIKVDILGLETLRLIERTIEFLIESKGGITELVIDGTTHRVPSWESIKLSDGSWKQACNVKEGDDIVVPLETLEA